MPLLEETGGRANGSVLDEDILVNETVEGMRGRKERKVGDLIICEAQLVCLSQRLGDEFGNIK